MKLLLQSDDYGMTKAVSKGIIHGINHGIIRNTGMFTNMPWAKECAEWIKPYLKIISLGIDLNITTGKPILPKEKVPMLVKENGEFFSSGERRKLKNENNELDRISYGEIYKEFEVQIERFIELIGQKPDYIHAHAYMSEDIIRIQRELSEKYKINYSFDVWKLLEKDELAQNRLKWYIKPPSLENQLKSSLKEYILENSQNILKKDYCIVVGHMGYIDKELMDFSTYSLYRINDLEAVTSPDIIHWVTENNVELVTYQSVKKYIKN